MGARPSKHVEPPPTQDIVKEAITEDDNVLSQQPQLTAELWQIILKEVEPEEFKILMDNCPQYKKELSSLAPSFLFPLLIRVLMKNGFLVENPLPILTYRLINSKVKAVIDSSLNESPPPWLTDAFTFSDSTKIDEFIRSFPVGGLPTDPCSPSLLQKTVEVVARRSNCFDSALVLFLGCGRWLTEVDLQLEFQPCPELLMRQLYVALNFLPNLEALHLSAVVEPRIMPPYNPLPPSYAPSLKNLKILSLCITTPRNIFGDESERTMLFLGPLVNSFLEVYGRRLQYFATCDAFFEYARLAAPQFSALFSELKELRIGFRVLRKATQVFELLQQITLPKLEELRLENYYDNESIPCIGVVKALQNFRNSLKTLWIGDLDGTCVCGIDPAELKVFPLLKKLVVSESNVNSQMWRIFYDQFKELEELRFQMGSEIEESSVPMEQLRGRFKIFPKLKRIIWPRAIGDVVMWR